jgi:hypothetical protein
MAIAYAKWIGAAVLLVLYSGFWYHLGGLGTRERVAVAQVKQEKAQDTKRTIDEATVAKEAKTYEAATDPELSPVSAPSVRLCHYTPVASVPGANAPGSGAHASAPVPAPAPAAALPGPDIGRPVLQVGHDADAQIAGLQDYIEHVCQAHAP